MHKLAGMDSAPTNQWITVLLMVLSAQKTLNVLKARNVILKQNNAGMILIPHLFLSLKKKMELNASLIQVALKVSNAILKQNNAGSIPMHQMNFLLPKSQQKKMELNARLIKIALKANVATKKPTNAGLIPMNQVIIPLTVSQKKINLIARLTKIALLA